MRKVVGRRQRRGVIGGVCWSFCNKRVLHLTLSMFVILSSLIDFSAETALEVKNGAFIYYAQRIRMITTPLSMKNPKAHPRP
jgi:hypothetical protein